MTTLFLIRHGETEWNSNGRWQGHTDVPLTERGREQARKLAQRLVEDQAHFDYIYASDLGRAFETAEIVAKPFGLPVKALPELREIDIGSWSGLTRAEIIERYPGAFSAFFHAHDGETWEAFGVRAGNALQRLVRHHPGEALALVTHGGTIRAMLHTVYTLQGHPDQEIPHIGNASLTELQLQNGRWHVRRFNDITHLEGAQAPDMLAPPTEGDLDE